MHSRRNVVVPSRRTIGRGGLVLLREAFLRPILAALLVPALSVSGCGFLFEDPFALDTDADAGGQFDAWDWTGGDVPGPGGWVPPAGVALVDSPTLYAFDTVTAEFGLTLTMPASSPTFLVGGDASLTGRLADGAGRREVVFRPSSSAPEETVFPADWHLPAMGSVGPSGEVVVCANRLTGGDSDATVGELPDPAQGVDLRCRVRDTAGVWGQPFPVADQPGAVWLSDVAPADGGFALTYASDGSGTVLGDETGTDGLYQVSVGSTGATGAPVQLESFASIGDPGLPSSVPEVGAVPGTDDEDWWEPVTCRETTLTSLPHIVSEKEPGLYRAFSCGYSEPQDPAAPLSSLNGVFYVEDGWRDDAMTNVEWLAARRKSLMDDIGFGDSTCTSYTDEFGQNGTCELVDYPTHLRAEKSHEYLDGSSAYQTVWIRGVYRDRFRIIMQHHETRDPGVLEYPEEPDRMFLEVQHLIDQLIGADSGECTEGPPGGDYMPASAGLSRSFEFKALPPVPCFENSIAFNLSGTAHGLDNPCVSGWSGSGGVTMCTELACVKDCFNATVTFGGQHELEKQCVLPPTSSCDDESRYCDTHTLSFSFDFDRTLKAPLNFKLWKFKAGCELSVSGGGGVQVNMTSFDGPACPCDRPHAGTFRLTQSLSGGGECALRAFGVDLTVPLVSASVCVNETVASPDPTHCDHGVALLGGFNMKVETPPIKLKWFEIKAAVVSWPRWGTGCTGATDL